MPFFSFSPVSYLLKIKWVMNHSVNPHPVRISRYVVPADPVLLSPFCHPGTAISHPSHGRHAQYLGAPALIWCSTRGEQTPHQERCSRTLVHRVFPLRIPVPRRPANTGYAPGWASPCSRPTASPPRKCRASRRLSRNRVYRQDDCIVRKMIVSGLRKWERKMDITIKADIPPSVAAFSGRVRFFAPLESAQFKTIGIGGVKCQIVDGNPSNPHVFVDKCVLSHHQLHSSEGRIIPILRQT